MPTRPTPRPSAPAQQTPTADPTKVRRTMPFKYERHSFGEHKKASMANVEVTTTEDEDKPDKNYLSLQKRLIESPALNAIRQCDARFRILLKYQYATPMAPGLYEVPMGLCARLAQAATAWEAERSQLADVAANAYDDMKAQMPAKLGPLFNADDYPTKERFRSTFWVSWRFIDMGVPGELRHLDPAVFEQERRKLEAETAKARQMIQQHLRTTLLEITDHLAGLLKPKSDGKFKALRDDVLTDFLQFIESEPLRNTTNDADLKRVVGTLKQLAGKSGWDLDQIKDDQQLRVSIANGMEQAKESLASLIVTRNRAIRVRD